MVNELLDQKPLMIRSAVRLKRRKEKVQRRKAEDTSSNSAVLKEARRDLALSRGDFLSTARPSIGDGMV
jgi:hypothetical protein